MAITRLEIAYTKAYGEELGAKMYGELMAAAKEVVEKSSKQASAEVSDKQVENTQSGQTRGVEPAQFMPEQPKQEEQTPVEDYTVRKKKPQENEATEKEEPKKNSFIWRILDDMEKNAEKSDDPTMALFLSVFKMALKYASGHEEFNQQLDAMEKDPTVKDVVKEAPIKEAPAKEVETVKLSNEQTKSPLDLSLDEILKVNVPNAEDIKIKSSAELKCDKIFDGKETVTMEDLKPLGVTNADLQPTLKTLLKDNPEKQSQLIPEGLGNENAPIGKELAVALIGRAEQREAIARHNAMQRA